MKTYAMSGYSYFNVTEIPFSEIDRIDVVRLGEPTQSPLAWYKAQAEKPGVVTNGGFYNTSNGAPVMTLVDEGKTAVTGTIPSGMGITGDKTLALGPRTGTERDYISAYPVLIENGKAAAITYATEINYRARRTIYAWTSDTLYIITIDAPGMNFAQAQARLLDLGVEYAVNLDGGGSTIKVVDGERVTAQAYVRPVDNAVAVYLKKEQPKTEREESVLHLNTQILTENDCYKAGKKIIPKGVFIHSTGANNPNLRRYVQPDDGKLGVNKNGNSWNRPGVSKCVHAMIGKLADGTVATYQLLPWNHRGWHAGTGTSGKSANDTHIGFEICEDALTDKTYFDAVYREAVELTAYLCKMNGFDPMEPGVVICHAEGYDLGIASNHGDVEHWFPKHGKSMDDFRADVRSAMGEVISEEQKKFDTMMDNYLARLAKTAPDKWSEAVKALVKVAAQYSN